MEQPDKDLMAEVEGIINNAAKDIKENKRTEMLGMLDAIATNSEQHFSYDEEPYALILIQQIGLDQVDESIVAHRPKGAEGKSLEQLGKEGYGAGGVTTPYQARTLDDLREVLDSPVNQMLTDVTMGKRDWASVTRHKTNGATVYLMVSGGCVTSWTKTPSGEIVTLHQDATEVGIDTILKSLSGEDRELLRSQWSFTAHIQTLRHSYPKSYAELVSELERRMEEDGDEQ